MNDSYYRSGLCGFQLNGADTSWYSYILVFSFAVCALCDDNIFYRVRDAYSFMMLNGAFHGSGKN